MVFLVLGGVLFWFGFFVCYYKWQCLQEHLYSLRLHILFIYWLVTGVLAASVLNYLFVVMNFKLIRRSRGTLLWFELGFLC